MRLDRGRRPYVPSFSRKRRSPSLFYVGRRCHAIVATAAVVCLQPFSSLQADLYSVVKERRRLPTRGTFRSGWVRWTTGNGFQAWRRYGGRRLPQREPSMPQGGLLVKLATHSLFLIGAPLLRRASAPCVNDKLADFSFLSSRGQTCNDFRGLRGTALWFALHGHAKATMAPDGPAARGLWTRAARRRRERLSIFSDTPRTPKIRNPFGRSAPFTPSPTLTTRNH